MSEMMKEAINQKLFQFQFTDAARAANSYPGMVSPDALELIDALARQYGNVTTFSGDQGIIIKHALANIGVYDDEVDNDTP